MKLLLSVILAAMVVVVFGQTAGHEFVNFDDNTYLTANPAILQGFTLDTVKWAFTTGYGGNWHPLTWLSHLLDYELFAMAPAGHHLVNVTLHAANTLLLFFLLAKLTNTVWRSFLVAALFAVHPLHVESVVWVAERKDLLCTFFWLISIHLYVRYTGDPRPGRYLVFVAAFALGLMCKPMIVTLPFLLLIIDFWPLQRTARPAAPYAPATSHDAAWVSIHIPDKLPLMLMSLVSSVMTINMQEQAGSLNQHMLLNIGNAVVSYVKYMMNMVWPARLAVFYPFIRESITVTNVLPAAAFIVLSTVSAVIYRRRFPYLLSGWLWFLVTLLPVIGIIRIGRHAIADRYTYMPLVGLFIILVWGFSDIASFLRLRTRMTAVAAAAVIALLMAVSYRQAGYWQNSYTLFRHALEVTDNNCISQNNLGEALINRGRFDEAFPYIVEAIRIKPDFEVAYNNLGIIYFNTGRPAEAEAAFQSSIRLKPSYAQARFNLALLYFKLGRRDRALDEYAGLTGTSPELAAQLKKIIGR